MTAAWRVDLRSAVRGVVLALCAATAFAQAVAPVPVPAASAGGHTNARHAPRAQLASGVAFAPDGSLWMAGLNAHGDLFVQNAPANKLSEWSAPRLVVSRGEAISADGENRPKLAFGPNGWVVISYTQPLAKPYTGAIRMLRSSDGGQTFSQPFTVHSDRQEITHRFESVAFDAQGVLHTLWVDKRDMELAPKLGKKSSYRGAAIYRNTSSDGGASFGPDIKLTDHTCECCRIALAHGPDGNLRAMWRHVFEPNVRDHGFAAVGGTAPADVVRASFDDWHIDACPHHGPGLAAAADGGYHAVWFGIRKKGNEETAAVRYARLRADGSPLLESVRALPDERAEHADVLVSGSQVAVVWRSVNNSQSTLYAWLSKDGGKSFQLRTLSKVQGDNDHPRLAQSGERMVAVWRNANEVQVHELKF